VADQDSPRWADSGAAPSSGGHLERRRGLDSMLAVRSDEGAGCWLVALSASGDNLPWPHADAVGP
jgi:hypothetical protein